MKDKNTISITKKGLLNKKDNKMLSWETITEKTTARLKVPGGWIVKSVHSHGHTWVNGASDAIGVGMVFISDPNHEWKIEEQ